MPGDGEALGRRQEAEAEDREGADGSHSARLPAACALQGRAADQREPQDEQIEDRLADDGEKLRTAQGVETARGAIENRHETDERTDRKKKANANDAELCRGFAQLLAFEDRAETAPARARKG